MSSTFIANLRDRGQFEALMQRSYKKVYNMVFRLSGNRADAEDLTQEAFYRAYRSFEDYEGDRPFENWILRIAARLFLDLLRNRKRRIKAASYDAPLMKEATDEALYFDVPDRAPNAEQKLMRETLSEDLQLALNSLNKDQQTLIVLADVEGISYKEIAKKLGKPIGTIRSRLHRTHRVLRDRMRMIQQGETGRLKGRRLKLQTAS